MNEWQFTNQFFEEGKIAYLNSLEIKDCPYDYLAVEQDNISMIQSELYRQKEWLAGFNFAFVETLHEKKTA